MAKVEVAAEAGIASFLLTTGSATIMMVPINFNLCFKYNQTDIYYGFTSPQFTRHYQTAS
jgi:hypothetical protein